MKKYKNIKEYLKIKFNEDIKDVISDEEPIEYLCDYIRSDEWPTDEGESLDIENFEILDLTNDKLTLCAGGDWQDPKTFEVLLVDDKIKIVVLGNEFNEGMSYEKFFSILFDIKQEEDWIDMDFA